MTTTTPVPPPERVTPATAPPAGTAEAMTVSIRAELHRLVDTVADSELATAWRVLEALSLVAARRAELAHEDRLLESVPVGRAGSAARPGAGPESAAASGGVVPAEALPCELSR
jgi:hypothetical protein